MKVVASGDAENTKICCFPDASRQGAEPGYLRPESPWRPSLWNISFYCCRKRNRQESMKLPQVIQWAVPQACPGSPPETREELGRDSMIMSVELAKHTLVRLLSKNTDNNYQDRVHSVVNCLSCSTRIQAQIPSTHTKASLCGVTCNPNAGEVETRDSWVSAGRPV